MSLQVQFYGNFYNPNVDLSSLLTVTFCLSSSRNGRKIWGVQTWIKKDFDGHRWYIKKLKTAFLSLHFHFEVLEWGFNIQYMNEREAVDNPSNQQWAVLQRIPSNNHLAIAKMFWMFACYIIFGPQIFDWYFYQDYCHFSSSDGLLKP